MGLESLRRKLGVKKLTRKAATQLTEKSCVGVVDAHFFITGHGVVDCISVRD
jgi:hypothetical protein